MFMFYHELGADMVEITNTTNSMKRKAAAVYGQMQNQPDDACLIFWKWFESVDERHRALALAVRRILTVPASSVESERVFSTAGRVLEARRTRMSDELFEAIIRINKNWWVLSLPDMDGVGFGSEDREGSPILLTREQKERFAMFAEMRTAIQAWAAAGTTREHQSMLKFKQRSGQTVQSVCGSTMKGIECSLSVI
jgi:hypothetical protein